MRTILKHTPAWSCPWTAANVDTDQIIPKQFLKRIERTGFGQFLFFDWRFLRRRLETQPGLRAQPPEYAAPACFWPGGTSAAVPAASTPLGLEDYGFRVIIAPSFADIFYNNCFKNGMLPVLSEVQVEDLFSAPRLRTVTASRSIWRTGASPTSGLRSSRWTPRDHAC